MSYEVQTYEGSVNITKLQGIVTRELKKQGIMIENGIRIYSKTLGKVIELDSLIREDWIIIEFWHSKDQGYRATKKGKLRIPKFKKDVAKTRYYLKELGLLPLWIDQAKFNPNVKYRREEILNLLYDFIKHLRELKEDSELWLLSDSISMLESDDYHALHHDALRFDYSFELDVSRIDLPTYNQKASFKLQLVSPEELAELVKPK